LPSRLYNAITKLMDVEKMGCEIDDVFSKVIGKLQYALLEEKDVLSMIDKLYNTSHDYREYEVDVNVDIYIPITTTTRTTLITHATKVSLKSVILVINIYINEISIGIEPCMAGLQITITSEKAWFFRAYDVAMMMLNVKEFYEIISKAYSKYGTDDLKYLKHIMERLMGVLAPLENKLRVIIEQQTN